jgi:phytoene dehydrogenase-like protein
MAARGFDFRERILWRTVISPADRERATRAPGGAVGGLAATGLRSLWRRPANDSSVHGLFLVGASTHPGPGLLPFAGQSAAFVADMIGRA